MRVSRQRRGKPARDLRMTTRNPFGSSRSARPRASRREPLLRVRARMLRDRPHCGAAVSLTALFRASGTDTACCRMKNSRPGDILERSTATAAGARRPLPARLPRRYTPASPFKRISVRSGKPPMRRPRPAACRKRPLPPPSAIRLRPRWPPPWRCRGNRAG